MAGGRCVEDHTPEAWRAPDLAANQLHGVPQHRHLLETRRTLGEMAIDRAREDPAGNRRESETTRDNAVQHLPRTQTLKPQTGPGGDDLAPRGWYLQEPVDALPRIRLQDQGASAGRCREAEGGGSRRLADSPLAGDDKQFMMRQRRWHSAPLPCRGRTIPATRVGPLAARPRHRSGRAGSPMAFLRRWE